MQSERTIVVEFKSNKDNFVRILIWYYWKRLMLVHSFLILFGLLLFYPVGNFFGITDSEWFTWTFFLGLFLFCVFRLYTIVLRPAAKLGKIANPTKAIFSEFGLETRTPTRFTQEIWENYSKIYETETDFIFLQQKNVFEGIPKRFFKTQNEIDLLRSLIIDKLGKKAKLQN